MRIIHDADRVVIVVDDYGPGIPPKEHEGVFAPFYRRGAGARSRQGRKSHGLGLSIARNRRAGNMVAM